MSDTGTGFSIQPEFEGELSVGHVPDDFIARLERRIEVGLLSPGRRGRANYQVREATRDGLTFEAADFLTAYAIGLNRVEVRRSSPSTVSYRVRFDRWSRTVTIQGLILGLLMMGASFVPAARREIQAPGGGGAIFWSMLFFWSLVWPRILVAIHRPFARRALERILLEVLGEVAERRSA